MSSGGYEVYPKLVFEEKLSNGMVSLGYKFILHHDFPQKDDSVMYVFHTNHEKLEAMWVILGDKWETSPNPYRRFNNYVRRRTPDSDEGSDSDVSDHDNDEADECFRLDKLQLLKCNQEIHGNYLIQKKRNDPDDFRDMRGTFDTKSELIDGSVVLLLTPSNPFVTVTMFIFYHDADDERVVKSSLIDDYNKFFANEKLRDVTFVVGDEKIQAHLQILAARNKVLAKMFDSDAMEEKISCVKIPEIEPNTFKLLLKFIYSEKFESGDGEESLKVLQAAHKYSIENLVHKSALCLSDNLTIDCAVDALLITEQVHINLKFLKEKCISFIISYKEEVSETESYKNMVKFGRVDLLSEIFLETPNISSGRKFPENVTVDNIVAVLIKADLEHDDDLKKKCLKLIAENKHQVAKTEHYKKMIEARRTNLLSEIFLSTTNLRNIRFA